MEPFLEKLKEQNGFLQPTPNYITTKADRLLECVNMVGELKMENAARALEVPLERIHDWALAMEKKELLKLRFSLRHGMILISNKCEKGGSIWRWL